MTIMGIIGVLIGLTSGGAAGIQGVDIVPRLSAEHIIPSAPLSIELAVTVRRSECGDLRYLWIDNDFIAVHVLNPKGEVVSRSTPATWRCAACDPRHRWAINTLPPADQYRKKLVFQEWCATDDLSPGEYTVSIDLLGVDDSIGEADVGQRISLSPPLHWTFTLTVMTRDDDAVRAEYGRLFDIAMRDGHSQAERETRFHSIESIVYARTPLALPYQLKLLGHGPRLMNGRFETAHVLDLATRYSESPNASVARGLVELLQTAGEMDPWIRTVLVWTIYNMRDKGDPAILSITEKIVQDNPRPKDPRPIPGLD